MSKINHNRPQFRLQASDLKYGREYFHDGREPYFDDGRKAIGGDMIYRLLHGFDEMNDWEQNFIQSLYDSGQYKFTEKQREKVKAIYEKVFGGAK